MIDIIKEFAIGLTGVVDQKGIDNIQRAVDDTSESVSAFVTGAVGLLTAGAFVTAIRATADRFDALGDVAARMGNTTVEELDRIGYVAELTGSDAQTAAASMENLSKAIGEASNGVGRGATAFKDFGLSAKNADGSVKSTGQVLDDIKVKLEGLSAAEQQAMIMRLGLDRSMIGMLTDDTTAIVAEYEKRTKALGLNADEAAEISGNFNDQIGRMTRGFGDVTSAFVVRILPAINEALENVADWTTDSSDKIRGFIEPVAKGVDVAVRIVNGATKGFAAMIDLLGNLPIVLAMAGVAWMGFNKIVAMSPVGRFVTGLFAVVSAIGLLMDDFETAKQGGESFFKFWDKPWFQPLLKGITLVVSAIKGMISLVEFVAELVGNILVGNFSGAFDMVFGIVEKGLSKMKSLFTNGLKSLFGFDFDNDEDNDKGKPKPEEDNDKGKPKPEEDNGGDRDNPKQSGRGELTDIAIDVNDLRIAPAADVKPSITNSSSSVSNNSTTVSQTFNVNSREDASFISKQTMRRYAGGVA